MRTIKLLTTIALPSSKAAFFSLQDDACYANSTSKLQRKQPDHRSLRQSFLPDRRRWPENAEDHSPLRVMSDWRWDKANIRRPEYVNYSGSGSGFVIFLHASINRCRTARADAARPSTGLTPRTEANQKSHLIGGEGKEPRDRWHREIVSKSKRERRFVQFAGPEITARHVICSQVEGACRRALSTSILLKTMSANQHPIEEDDSSSHGRLAKDGAEQKARKACGPCPHD